MESGTSPLPQERHQEILAELEVTGSVRVTELAKRYSVADETIRRDLEKLSQAGRLVRTHGGALCIRSDRVDLPLAIRRNKRAAEKQIVARHALRHINPGDVIAIDASTTALELVCLLEDIPLTVITYGLDAARLLIDRPEIKVISTGGELDPQSVCLLGPIAEATLRQFSINKLFCSCKGIDLERGYSEASTSHASMKRQLMDIAECTYLMVDHSKFGVRSLSFSGDLEMADVVITDGAAEEQFLDGLRGAGVEIEIASG